MDLGSPRYTSKDDEEDVYQNGYTGSLWCSLSAAFFLFLFLFLFLGPLLWCMDVPRLGVKSELQLPAYTTATVTWDPSRICNLHLSSQQPWILNPLSEARGGTCVLMDASQMRFC